MLKNSKGLTLIEVLAAVAILGIVIAAFVSISNYSMLANQQNDREIEAIQIAENVVNDVRDFIARTGRFPDAEPVSSDPKYHIYIQHSQLRNMNSGDYDRSKFENKEHVSIQTIVYLNMEPRLLTVTVYWEG
jgi:prepilin-type N-terminal cleavage/methylation domain-containing protein